MRVFNRVFDTNTLKSKLTKVNQQLGGNSTFPSYQQKKTATSQGWFPARLWVMKKEKNDNEFSNNGELFSCFFVLPRVLVFSKGLFAVQKTTSMNSRVCFAHFFIFIHMILEIQGNTHNSAIMWHQVRCAKKISGWGITQTPRGR